MRSPLVRLVLPVVAVVVVGACASAPPAPPVDTAAITTSVDSLTRAFVAAVAARDTDAVAAFYAADAQVLPPNAPKATGPEAIRKVWAEFLGFPDLNLVPTTGQVIVSEAGDLAIDVGTYTLKMTGPGNKPIEDVGKYVTALRKTDGGWKIIIDTWTSDLPAPGN